MVKTSLSAALAGVCLVLGLSAAQAEDVTPPVVNKPIADITVKPGALATSINLQNTFGLKGVSQEVVRFTTTLGTIDVELFPATTPKTVANFLGYVNRGAAENGGYNGSLIQRVIVNPRFIVQGGSLYFRDVTLYGISMRAAVESEAGIPNTEGTIGMVLGKGPDTATDAWYFNLADNTTLDGTKDGGPYTVFGRVIGNGMGTINAIAGLTIYNLSNYLGTAGNLWETVPLVNYNISEGLDVDDFVYTESIAPISTIPASPGGVGLIEIRILHNTNPDMVTATLVGRRLKLTYLGKRTGMARITLEATDAANSKLTTSFTVRVAI